MIAVAFDVVALAGLTTSLDTITDVVSARWRSLQNLPGDFELTVAQEQLADVPIGDVLRVALNSTVVAHYLIEDLHEVRVSPQEEAKPSSTVTGRSIDAVCDRLAVFPTLGAGRKPFADSRCFSFADPSYMPDGSWVVPTVLVATPLTASAHWTGLPGGYWGLGEPWIGPSSGTDEEAPAGYCYFIYDFTMEADTSLVFAMAADNSALVFMDGFQLTRIDPSDDPESGYRRTTVTTCFLSAGDHRFAVKLINDAGFAGEDPGFGVGPTLAGNPTGFIMTAWVFSGGGDLTPGRSFGTADYLDWLVLEYPSDPPGFTFDEIVSLIIAENPGADVTITVDASAADATQLESVTPQVGDSLLKVLQDGAGSGYCDWQVQVVAGALKLKLWPFGGMGGASGVTYVQSTDPAVSTLDSLQLDQTDRTTVDALIVRYKDGQALVPSAGGTRVGYRKYDGSTLDEATKLATQAIADSTQPQQVTAAVVPTGTGDVPWLHVALGDTVAFDPLAGATVTEEAQELVGSLDGDYLEFAYTVKDLRLDGLTLAKFRLDHLSNGSNGNGLNPSQPAGDRPKFSSMADGSGERIQVDDGATLPVVSPPLVLQSSRNLYAVAASMKTAPTTDATFEWLVDTVDVLGGAGVLPAGETVVVIPVPDPSPGGLFKTIWIEGNVTVQAVNFIDLGGGSGLVLEGRFV